MANPTTISCSICLNSEPADELEAFPIPHSAVSSEFVTKICVRCIGAIAAHLAMMGEEKTDLKLDAAAAALEQIENPPESRKSQGETENADSIDGDQRVAAVDPDLGSSRADKP